jgi:hypothetical protein
LDVQGVEEIHNIVPERGLLSAAHGVLGQKARRTEAAQIWHDHTCPRACEAGHDLVKGMDVVGEAMQQHNRPTRGRTFIEKGDLQNFGLNCLQLRHSFTTRQGRKGRSGLH